MRVSRNQAPSFEILHVEQRFIFRKLLFRASLRSFASSASKALTCASGIAYTKPACTATLTAAFGVVDHSLLRVKEEPAHRADTSTVHYCPGNPEHTMHPCSMRTQSFDEEVLVAVWAAHRFPGLRSW